MYSSYDYFIDVEYNGEVYCSFSTLECDYTVYFNPHEYSKRIAEYPNLLQNSFGFGFFQFPKEGTKIPKFDSRIKHTIEIIICNFFHQNPGSILRYHCDHADGRQAIRSKKFQRWYSHSPAKSLIIMQEISLDILINDSYETFYIGYLCSKSNKSLHDIRIEFESFAVNLTSDTK